MNLRHGDRFLWCLAGPSLVLGLAILSGCTPVNTQVTALSSVTPNPSAATPTQSANFSAVSSIASTSTQHGYTMIQNMGTYQNAVSQSGDQYQMINLPNGSQSGTYP